MPESMKRILSVILLVVFLIPSAGIMIYMRHCNYSGKVSIELETSGCCAKHGSSPGMQSCCNLHFLKAGGKEIISASKCCDNSNIYIKLGAHLAVDRLLVSNLFPALITSHKYYLTTDIGSSLMKPTAEWISYPPWENAYLKYSSLRL